MKDRYVVKSAKTGKYLRKRDQWNKHHPEKWTGTIDNARVFNRLSHVTQSVGREEVVNSKEVVNYCRYCKTNHNLSYKFCPKCGRSLYTGAIEERKTKIPADIEVVPIHLTREEK